MGKNSGVFKRYEKKYLLNSKQYDEILKKLDEYMVPDKYGNSTICNIYCDTPDYRLIRTSIEKPVYKEKIRLRTYGVPNDDTNSFLEIKKKFKGVVYKRRIVEKYSVAFGYINGNRRGHDGDAQISKEIEWALNYYKNVQPAMFISYDRTALFYKNDSELRITFDSNITWRNCDLDLRSGVYGERLLDDGNYIMEIKIPMVMPLWLSRILDELDVYPVSFSKYGTAYKNSLLLKKGEGIKC